MVDNSDNLNVHVQDVEALDSQIFLQAEARDLIQGLFSSSTLSKRCCHILMCCYFSFFRFHQNWSGLEKEGKNKKR